MGNIPFFDILILAMIAVFILNRLRNVLGKKTGNEEDISQNLNVKTKLKETKPDRELNLKNNKDLNKSLYNLHEDRDINKALNAIKKIESSFELENFVDKAKIWKPFGGQTSIQKIKDALQIELRSVVQGIERKIKLLHRYKKQCDEIGPYGGVDKARMRAEALLTEKSSLSEKFSQVSSLRTKFMGHLAQRSALVNFFLYLYPL